MPRPLNAVYATSASANPRSASPDSSRWRFATDPAVSITSNRASVITDWNALASASPRGLNVMPGSPVVIRMVSGFLGATCSLQPAWERANIAQNQPNRRIAAVSTPAVMRHGLQTVNRANNRAQTATFGAHQDGDNAPR